MPPVENNSGSFAQERLYLRVRHTESDIPACIHGKCEVFYVTLKRKGANLSQIHPCCALSDMYGYLSSIRKHLGSLFMCLIPQAFF